MMLLSESSLISVIVHTDFERKMVCVALLNANIHQFVEVDNLIGK